MEWFIYLDFAGIAGVLMAITKTEAVKVSDAAALARISGEVKNVLNRMQDTQGLEKALGNISGLERLLESAKETNNPNTLIEFARRFRQVAKATGIEAPDNLQTSIVAAENALETLNSYITCEQETIAVPHEIYLLAKKLHRKIEDHRKSEEKKPKQLPEPLD